MHTIKINSILITVLFLSIPVLTLAQEIEKALSSRLDQLKSTHPKERVLIINDRDIYAPGDVIWLAAYTYDMYESKIVDQSDQLTLELVNADNTRINNQMLNMNKGRCYGAFVIPKDIKEGLYFLQGHTKRSEPQSLYYRKVLIKEKVVPPFVVQSEMEDKQYVPGDRMSFTLRFMDYYNEPRKNVEFQVSFYDGSKKVKTVGGKTKKDGLGLISFTLPASINSGYIYYKVDAEAKGNSTTLHGTIPVVPQAINIDYALENDKLMDNQHTTVHFYAYGEYGQPAVD